MFSCVRTLSLPKILGFFTFSILLAFAVWAMNDPYIHSKLTHRCFVFWEKNVVCYDQYYEKLAKAQGVEAALNTLHARIENDHVLARSCHNTMHVIGRQAFREYGSLTRAYAHADYTCWSGYSHGVVEGALRGKKPSDISPTQLQDFCKGSTSETLTQTFATFNCTHGLGHAIMYIADNDIPQALTKCSELNDAWAIGNCATGVFMENTLADDDHPSRFTPTDDLNSPCNAVAPEFKQACYLVQGAFIIDHMAGDFGKSFSFCETIETHAHRIQCARGLGKMASEHSGFDPIRAKQYCDTTRGELREACIFGVVQDMTGATGDTKRAEELCTIEDSARQAQCRTLIQITTQKDAPLQ